MPSFQFVLSKQKAKVEHLTDAYSVSDIVDVGAFSRGFVVQLASGVLLQIAKRGRDVNKTRIPIAPAAKICVREKSLRFRKTNQITQNIFGAPREKS